MLRKLLAIFTKRGTRLSVPRESSTHEIAVFRNGVYEVADDDSDIIAGYIFTATLSPRTALNVLLQHGKVVSKLPCTEERTAQQDGVWCPKTKSWAELGAKLPMMKELPGLMASAVGPIPEDGGEFLILLKEFRRLIEGAGTPPQRAAAAWAITQTKPEWREFANKLGWKGTESLDDYAGFNAAIGCPNISTKLAKALYLAGFNSVESIRGAQDRQLLAVKGIGPAHLKEIRLGC